MTVVPSSIAVISRFASAPLPWVQWLSGKSVRTSNQKLWGSIPSWIPVDFLCHFCAKEDRNANGYMYMYLVPSLRSGTDSMNE